MSNLIAELTKYFELGPEMIWAAALVFFRVGAAMAMIPAFGEQAVPQRVRLVLALAFALVVLPAVSDKLPMLDTGFVLPIVSESLIGLALGFALRLFVMALQIAGAIAAQATSLAQMVGGPGPEPQPAITNLLVIAGLALSVATGLHVRVAEFLIGSYQLLPAGHLPDAKDMADWGLFRISTAFNLAFSLAASFSIAALLYNVALGVINRAMPTLMVTFIGAPALTAGGLLMLMLMAPPMLVYWLELLTHFFNAPFKVMP